MYSNNSTNTTITAKPAFLRLANILFGALLMGQLLFLMLVVLVINKGRMLFSIPTASDVFVIVVPLMAVASVAVGIFLFKSQLSKAKVKNDLPGKLQIYLTATIIRFALIEGVSLLGIVVSMISFNLFYDAISALLIIYMASLRPTGYRLDNDLNL